MVTTAANSCECRPDAESPKYRYVIMGEGGGGDSRWNFRPGESFVILNGREVIGHKLRTIDTTCLSGSAPLFCPSLISPDTSFLSLLVSDNVAIFLCRQWCLWLLSILIEYTYCHATLLHHHPLLLRTSGITFPGA